MTVTEGFLRQDGVFDEPLPAAPLGDPADCVGQDAEAGLVAWHEVLNHVTWRRLRWIRETARARADVLERWPEPDPRVIAAALGWSVGMAASRIELAEGALERMPRLGAAMRDGHVEESKAGKFVVGLRDVDDEQARTVVDALIDEAPGLGVFELEQKIAAAVKDVDPDGAENRCKAAVARARVRTRTAPSGAVEIHGMDLDPDVAVPAFERLAAIADEVSGRLKAAGTDVPLSRVQASVYLRLLHGCPDGDNDDLAIADHVTEELLDPPTPDDGGPDDGGPDDGGPDDGGPDDGGPDDGGPDDGGPAGGGPDDGPRDDEGRRDGPADGGSGPDDPGPGGPDDPGPGGPGPGRPADGHGPAAGSDDVTPSGSPTPAGVPDLDALTGRFPADVDTRDNGPDDDHAEPEASPPPWQPGDPPPEPPPDDTPDLTIPTGEPPPPLTARLTDRGLEFRPATLRTSLFTALGLARAHGHLPVGALTGGDAHALAWARTCAQFRVLLHDDDGHLQWVLLVRPPHRPGADPRYRRQVVELTASTSDLDTLDVEGRLVGHFAELARRTKAALERQRARPPVDHPATTTADAINRFPGAELARWVQARDRTCRFPMCTVAAVACHLDHTHDWLLDGPTQADNLGALSVGDHLRKHDLRSGWTVEQPTPGRFVWTSPTGTTHTVEPEPHRALRPMRRARYDHGITDTDEPTTQRPWRPRTDKHGHITDAARATLEEIDRRHRERQNQPPSTYDGDPPF
ncbi:HNH endonuclease signature motif containing protein [Actinomycetospora atypica]|uniref:DUF222 domain-containing protein n=1 Tax=Actinomycetospora atypica TaxID=1290095 RepID=A0ABV9YMX6_9PSEU